MDLGMGEPKHSLLVVLGLEAAEHALIADVAENCEIRHVNSILQLRELIKQEPIAAVLTEIWVRDGHVLEVHDLLKEMSPSTCLVIAASSLDEDMVDQVRRSGMPLVLQRPIRKMEFAAAIALVIGFCHARKELRSLQAVTQQMTTDIEEAARLKSEFLSLISHELRTPLTEVIGYAELLKEGAYANLHEYHQEYVDSILRSSNQLSSLIDDLMTLSKAEAHALEPKTSTFAVSRLVEGKVATLIREARTQGLKTEIRIDPAAGVIVADHEMLSKVLRALISNAIKFTPQGGTLGIEISNADSAVLFKVWDTGKGIAQERVRDIFRAFRQEDSSDRRQYGGLGLGLSIVKHLVALHGGNVRVTSRADQGTVFSFVIPRRGVAKGSNDQARNG